MIIFCMQVLNEADPQTRTNIASNLGFGLCSNGV